MTKRLYSIQHYSAQHKVDYHHNFSTSHYTHHTKVSVRSSAEIVIAIGASTGGPQALRTVLQHLPANTPGIVIAQHMPANFTRTFADNLNRYTEVYVKEAETGDIVEPGVVLLAPGDFQMRVVRVGSQYKVQCEQTPRYNNHRPSVDILMHSVAEQAGKHSIGVMLTGMGSDGALGMKAMCESGAHTIAQDEDSCVVFGMPRRAIEVGAAKEIAPLNNIASLLIERINKNNHTYPQ